MVSVDTSDNAMVRRVVPWKKALLLIWSDPQQRVESAVSEEDTDRIKRVKNMTTQIHFNDESKCRVFLPVLTPACLYAASNSPML